MRNAIRFTDFFTEGTEGEAPSPKNLYARSGAGEREEACSPLQHPGRGCCVPDWVLLLTVTCEGPVGSMKGSCVVSSTGAQHLATLHGSCSKYLSKKIAHNVGSLFA